MPVYYPLNDLEESFQYTPTVNEDTMAMVTSYNVTHSHKITDIMFLYNIVPLALWIGLFVSFIIVVISLYSGMKLLYPKRRIISIWSTFFTFIGQHDFLTDRY